MERKRVFSGLQPTGNIHIGNYLGALRNWVRLQDDYECVYCIVDLHAMTAEFDPEQFARERREAARVLIACGVDPGRSLFYYQSEVAQHTELAWILGTITGMGQLSRMTQYKEKAKDQGTDFGLFAYPVLMAADILLYRADAVPVGDDQKQHLELTRDLAERFNHRFGEGFFPIPEPIIPEHGARIMSLQDPTAKMSKSDPDVSSRVLVLDDPDTIAARIRAAVTDSGSDVRYDSDEKPGISNLIEIMSLFTERPISSIEDEYGSGGYGSFKQAVADAVIEGLAPIREAFAELDDEEVARTLEEHAARARERAETMLQGVRRRVGLR
ncbi:MAG TPA: tryptophan--tRNA ligase [Acidimicrobiia bacterium]|nr:tryptophan--tRNA ligase [Acidimicrobiia bacterium]